MPRPVYWRGARRDDVLLTLTLITVFLVVAALAGYLTAVAWALRDASRSVAAIADGLEAVRGHTAPVGEKLEAKTRSAIDEHRPQNLRSEEFPAPFDPVDFEPR